MAPFSSLRRRCDKDDCRQRRFVAVIECILDQNVRDRGAASFPAINHELLQILHEHGIGILQMPCPEIAALGPERSRPAGQSLRDALEGDAGRNRCAQLAGEVAARIDARVALGNRLLAVLGGNPRSPGCAVHPCGTGLDAASGTFVKALHAELRRRGHDAPFRGMRDHDPRELADDLAWLRQLLAADRAA